MNPKLAIVVIVFAVLMVAFGNDPIEEAREEHDAKYKGIEDPLIRAITEYHEESDPFASGRGNGLDESGRRQKVMPDYMYSRGNTTNAYATTPTTRTIQPQNTQPATQQQSNGYYPPPPLPKNNTRQRNNTNRFGQPMAPGSKQEIKSYKYLETGQELAYEGTKVFYYDGNGKKRALPDGKYKTADGREMLISGGSKVLASN